jgi:peptidylprolyl isomerase/peptidyl-prolyl cis-trans isomerase D
MNFAFKDKLDAVSDPISVTGGVSVFKVSSVREEGVRPLDEVQTIVRSQVLRQKKMQRMKERVDAFYGTISPSSDLLAAARSVQEAVAQKTGPFKATDSPQGVGRDYEFIGTALSLSPGQLSKPFEGTRGYYIMKLTSKTAFDSTQYANQRSSLQDQILTEKRNRLFTDWLTALRENAEIEDYRDRYYR